MLVRQYLIGDYSLQKHGTWKTPRNEHEKQMFQKPSWLWVLALLSWGYHDNKITVVCNRLFAPNLLHHWPFGEVFSFFSSNLHSKSRIYCCSIALSNAFLFPTTLRWFIHTSSAIENSWLIAVPPNQQLARISLHLSHKIHIFQALWCFSSLKMVVGRSIFSFSNQRNQGLCHCFQGLLQHTTSW